MIAPTCLLVPFLAAAAQDALPELVLTADDTRVERSCRVVVPPDTVIADANGDGVLHVVADGVRVELAPGSHLRGASPGTAGDVLAGSGLRVAGRAGVTLAGWRISGYKAGIHASAADGLVLEDCDLSGNFRQHLRSTPQAEDGADWLWPHRNDGNEWLTSYGAALYVEDSQGVVVRRSRAREGQNGIVLDRVAGARVYDNDFSFLSGWGLALWRVTDSTITRNAFDFCVRGYSHGVYNRGQDSAGILMFEQCSRNVLAENSATHGGDGIFGFAGREALGEAEGLPAGFDHARRGNNDNLFLDNDLSYAAAHGLELTFSFGNHVEGNRFAENAICGIWGGYSQETAIVANVFEGNGQAGYGLERGGVNIEHGRANLILQNDFVHNACGVHLWWDPDEGLTSRPWALANGAKSAANRIERNTFTRDEIGVHLRACEETLLVANRMVQVATPVDSDPGSVAQAGAEPIARPRRPQVEILGETRPVGARAELFGRHNIVMTEWGPWDHAAPLLRRTDVSKVSLEGSALARRTPVASMHAWSLSGFGITARVEASGDVSTTRLEGGICLVIARRQGLVPYVLSVSGEAGRREVRATIHNYPWSVRFFPWGHDPREDYAGWRADCEAERAVERELPELRLAYGGGGPGTLGLGPELEGAGIGNDHFGTVARAVIPLAAGRWRLATLSDDGVRVRADGEVVIENWTWHGPTRDEGLLALERDADVVVEVEHFELDGYAVLELDIEALD